MSVRPSFARDERASTAAEFALIVPVMLFFLLGIVDVGRFAWTLNQAEKATQIGARWAVVTDIIPSDLYDYSFTTQGGVPQGTVVPIEKFAGVDCTSAGCDKFDSNKTKSKATFAALVRRMNEIYGGIGLANVTVSYANSGLGYAGDPNGSDVDPLVTVRTTGLSFRPIFLAGIFDFGLPDLSYTLTMEDGKGDFAN